MRLFLGALAIVATLVVPAVAKNFAVPPKNPAMTVTFPEDWKITDIDYGFSARRGTRTTASPSTSSRPTTRASMV